MPVWTPEQHISTFAKMEEGEYPASLRTAEVAAKPDKNGNKVIIVHATVSGGDYAGKKVQVRRYTSEKALGLIASDLFALDVAAVTTEYDEPTAEELVDAYNEAAGFDFILVVKHNADKTDPSKIYENYIFRKVDG